MNTNSPIHGGKSAESFHATMLSVSLTVKDLAKSLPWYTDVLGFTVDRKIDRDGKVRRWCSLPGMRGSRSIRMMEPKDGHASKAKDSH